MEYFCIMNQKGLFEVGWFTSYKCVWQFVSVFKTRIEAWQEIELLTRRDFENEKQQRQKEKQTAK